MPEQNSGAERQRRELELMSQQLLERLNAMVVEQERRAAEFAAGTHSLSHLPVKPQLSPQAAAPEVVSPEYTWPAPEPQNEATEQAYEEAVYEEAQYEESQYEESQYEEAQYEEAVYEEPEPPKARSVAPPPTKRSETPEPRPYVPFRGGVKKPELKQEESSPINSSVIVIVIVVFIFLLRVCKSLS